MNKLTNEYIISERIGVDVGKYLKKKEKTTKRKEKKKDLINLNILYRH